MGLRKFCLPSGRTAAEVLRWFHGVMTIFWLVAVIPVLMIEGLKTSIALLIFISIYANVAGHFSSWQASRVEVKQDRADS